MRWSLLLFVAGCGRIGFDGGVPIDAATSGLVVTISEDRMAGPTTIASVAELPAGTIGLSLREALAIAKNHAGPDVITFDPAVFPASAPATIAIGAELEVEDVATQVDATATGVVIAPAEGYTGRLVEIFGTGHELDQLAFEGGASDAIFVGNASRITIADCSVSGAGPKPIHVQSSTDITIERAFVSLATKTGEVYGIRLESSQRVKVLDSVVDPGTAWMIALQDTTDSLVRGNIIDGGDTSIVLNGASHRNTVFLNVGIAPAYHVVYVDAPAENNVVLNNTAYQAPAGMEIFDAGIGTTIANTLISTSEADFVNPAAYDFHLVAGSPSIDAAIDDGQNMLPDGDGMLRFLGSGPDLGAVESY